MRAVCFWVNCKTFDVAKLDLDSGSLHLFEMGKVVNYKLIIGDLFKETIYCILIALVCCPEFIRFRKVSLNH